MTISVLGAGAFGTALAISLARDGQSVTLWARDTADMAISRENTRRLPGFAFPESLTIEDDLDIATDAIFCSSPRQCKASHSS